MSRVFFFFLGRQAVFDSVSEWGNNSFHSFVQGFFPHVSQHEEIAANESFLLGRPQAKEKKKKKKNSHVLE